MSDELPAGTLSLEEPTIVGAVSDPQTAPEPVADDDDATPEGTIEGSGGVKFVPLSAVIAERTKGKESKAEAARLKGELESVKAKAEEWDKLRPAVQAAMPLIEKVKGRADILAMLDKPPQQQAAPQPLSMDEAVEYAKDMDLYKPDGTPDVDRAQRLAARQEAIAARQAARAVAPFQANDAQRASEGLKSQFLGAKDAAGQTVDPGALESIWSIVPPELSAKPEVAQILYLAAKGMAAHAGKGAPAKQNPALVTESLGGGRAPAKELSDVELSFARVTGVSPSDFKKTASAFKPGAVNSLE